MLAFYAGQMLLKVRRGILVVMASTTALAAAATLIMATAIVPVAMVLMGYALGGGKVPWRDCSRCCCSQRFCIRASLPCVSFTGVERPALTLTVMPQYYVDWLGHGYGDFAASDGRDMDEGSEVSSLFERSGNVHMFLLVQRKSPNEVPFLSGITYEPIPRMLIPRMIDDEKGISHAGNVLLTVNYGVQTIEQTAGTSIDWGLVPEAYANFGYLGVAGLAVVLGIFYGYITNLTVGCR